MKDIVHSALTKVCCGVKRIVSRSDSDFEIEYVKKGEIPWSTGYLQARKRFISNALENVEVLEAFRKNNELPKKFGVGFDERCVEYPWLLSRLQESPERLLDAGSSLNHAFVVNHPMFREKKVHILTLAPEKNCYWYNTISYIFDDLRNIPIRDNYYDTVVCISTLEHVGLNNALFCDSKGHAEQCLDDFLLAVMEMRRVLRPGGKIFITVPYGRYCNYGTFQQFDAHLVGQTVTAFEGEQIEDTYFRYSADGWNFSTAEACANAEYVNWIMLPKEARPDRFPDHPDRAAAARAVACLLMIKPE